MKNEGHVHHGEGKRRKRKRRAGNLIVVCVLLCVVFISTPRLFPRRDEPGNSTITNPAEHRHDSTSDGQPTEKGNGREPLPSSATDSDWRLTLVNKWNPLPENDAVTLVEVPGGERVDERIYDPLMELLEAAKEENWNQLPTVVSGYRTREKQQKLYDEKIAQYKRQGYSEKEAVEQAGQWVAAPGYSEHQLGLAVDINGATYDLYFWLQENSYKYGFIFRYPAGKTDITGIAEEVWHYRYVGTEAATEMYEQGLCLEEYLEKTNP